MKRSICWLLVLAMLAATSAPTFAAPSGQRVLPGAIGGTLGDEAIGEPDEGTGITRIDHGNTETPRPRALAGCSLTQVSRIEWIRVMIERLTRYMMGLVP